MNRIQLEKGHGGHDDQMVFTLSNNEGVKYYGYVYRNLFRGISRRFDVKRRSKHSLCLISKFPFYSFFMNVLMDIYSFALLENYPRQFIPFAEHMFNFMQESFPEYGTFIYSQPSMLPGHITQHVNNAKFSWTLPRPGKTFFRDVSITPLFQKLGVEKWFKLLSALLSEQRIVFLAEDTSSLTSAINATMAMLHPFRWHYTLITQLPMKSLDLLKTSAPFIIGMKRLPTSELRMDEMTYRGIIWIDLDNGSFACDVPLRDFVGDAGNALKQATESLDRVRANMASVFLGKNGDSADNSNQRDLMVMLVQDLKSVHASRPGSSSIQSVASGLLRNLPVGGGKSNDEAMLQWNLEAEKALREILNCFYLYLFADVPDFYPKVPPGSAAPVAPREIRNRLEIRNFINQKNSYGISKTLFDFLQEFTKRDIFANYLDELLGTGLFFGRVRDSSFSRTRRSSNSDNNLEQPTVFPEVDEMFELTAGDVRSRGMLTSTVAKQAVSARTTLGVNENPHTLLSTGKISTSNLHSFALNFTANVGNSVDGEVVMNLTEFADEFGLFGINAAGFGRPMSLATTAPKSTIDAFKEVMAGCFGHDNIRKIFQTIAYRLECCKAANCRGAAGISGLKALQLLQIVLVQGPLQTISFGIELIPLIRSLLKVAKANQSQTSGSKSGVPLPAGALDFMSAGPFVDPKATALAVLSYLVDHRKLIYQRTLITIGNNSRHPLMKRVVAGLPSNLVDYTTRPPAKKELFQTNKNGQKIFVPFGKLHAHFNDMKLTSVAHGIVRTSVPQKAHAEKEDDDDVDGSTYGRSKAPSTANDNDLLDFGGAGDQFSADTSKTSASVVKLAPPPVSAPPRNKKPAANSTVSSSAAPSSSSSTKTDPFLSASQPQNSDPWTNTSTIAPAAKKSADPFASDPFTTSNAFPSVNANNDPFGNQPFSSPPPAQQNWTAPNQSAPRQFMSPPAAAMNALPVQQRPVPQPTMMQQQVGRPPANPFGQAPRPHASKPPTDPFADLVPGMKK